jgi:hypothetical protein
VKFDWWVPINQPLQCHIPEDCKLQNILLSTETLNKVKIQNKYKIKALSEVQPII